MTLPYFLRDRGDGEDVLLVDCLTLWLSSLLLARTGLEAASDALVHAMEAASASIILAAACPATDLVVAGIPMRIFDHPR